jgi:hypothetical protein
MSAFVEHSSAFAGIGVKQAKAARAVPSPPSFNISQQASAFLASPLRVERLQSGAIRKEN